MSALRVGAGAGALVRCMCAYVLVNMSNFLLPCRVITLTVAGPPHGPIARAQPLKLPQAPAPPSSQQPPGQQLCGCFARLDCASYVQRVCTPPWPQPQGQCHAQLTENCHPGSAMRASMMGTECAPCSAQRLPTTSDICGNWCRLAPILRCMQNSCPSKGACLLFSAALLLQLPARLALFLLRMCLALLCHMLHSKRSWRTGAQQALLPLAPRIDWLVPALAVAAA